MFKQLVYGLVFLIFFSFSEIVTAGSEADYQLFQNLFNQWTAAFNQKNLSGTCNLFAKSLTADYQGFPQKNYATLCDGFKKVFQEHDKSYQYRFKLHHVYRANDLAVIRITWYLKIIENKKLLSSTQDEGIDILKKQPDGEWKIVNYLGYPVKK